MALSDKLKPVPPKKLLSLDGGGIRGVITLEILARIEDILRQTKGMGNPGFRLADYFDYIAGTSTGAIIAACLSIGMSVSEISHFYHSFSKDMFPPAGYLKRLRYKYEDDKLSAQLKQVLGASTTLGSDTVRTLLMMVMRNATTDSPWPICNNPRAKYNDTSLPDCNLKLPIWQLVRASTAAPTYFPPEVVRIGDKEFLFVDGAVTTYNNPAFHLFLMATIEPYQLQWPAGRDKMLLVSVGTGTVPKANASLRANDMNLLFNARSIPEALIFAAQNEQDFLCRAFGDCLVGSRLDSEVGDMKVQKGPTDSKMFTYIRLNAELSQVGLESLGLPNIRPEDIQRLDSVDHIEELRQIGQAVAKNDLHLSCFNRF